MFDFLLDNPEALDLAFEVLSQWLSAATLQPDDVEAERGIVLDEYRLRHESANGRIAEFLNAIYYTGSIYDGMLIGGDEETNSAITAALLREFYETWYRPDNAAVIIVGDLPVAEMEQKVEQYFGGLARAHRSDPGPTRPTRLYRGLHNRTPHRRRHRSRLRIRFDVDRLAAARLAGKHRGRRSPAIHGGSHRSNA